MLGRQRATLPAERCRRRRQPHRRSCGRLHAWRRAQHTALQSRVANCEWRASCFPAELGRTSTVSNASASRLLAPGPTSALRRLGLRRVLACPPARSTWTRDCCSDNPSPLHVRSTLSEFLLIYRRLGCSIERRYWAEGPDVWRIMSRPARARGRRAPEGSSAVQKPASSHGIGRRQPGRSQADGSEF